MNHSIFSDCKGSAFFKCGHLFSAEVIPVLFTDFRIFDSSKIGCGSEVELKNKFFVRTSLTFRYLCRTKQKLMVQIDDVIVSLDVFREKFLCDLHACKGECCIEGDAGAPVELEEVEKLEEVLPVIWDDLAPEAQEVIKRQGVVYTEEEGDLVLSSTEKTAYLPATMRKAIVIVPSKKHTGKGNATSTNRFPATCIRYA